MKNKITHMHSLCNFFPKNRKGFLLGEETAKTVIAVISILFLVGFLVALYFSYTKNKDLEQAEASLEHLISAINSGAGEVEIWNPKDWGVISFSSEALPDFCLEQGWEKCICVCTKGPSVQLRNSCLTKNNKQITCLENDYTIHEMLENPPLILTINQRERIITRKTSGGATADF